MICKTNHDYIAGMLRLVSEILPSIESAKQCDFTVEICKGGLYPKLCISDFTSVFI